VTASLQPDALLRAAGAIEESFRAQPPPNGTDDTAPPDETRNDFTESGAMDGFRQAAKEATTTRSGSPRPAPLKLVDPRLLAGIVVPDRRWIVQDWLPARATTSLYGDGGTGKTLLAQQLMTSCATGRPWTGLAVERCRSLALFCEDDDDELHRRQYAINEAMGVGFGDLGDVRWLSGVGADNLLMIFNGPQGELSARFLALEEAAKEFGARLVIIDTAADTFGGNENDRAQVRQFIGHALTRLALAIDGAVLLCAHPSRSGLGVGGDLDGGSTGWSNSVRSRWSLARPAGEDVEKDTPERILTRRKANYASIGDEIRLRWEKGALLPVNRPSALQQMSRHEEAEQAFLKLLDSYDAANRHLSGSAHAGNFAPKVFSKDPASGAMTRRDFEGAMNRLFAANRITMMSYGRPSDERRRLARTGAEEASDEFAL
jgi:RecA-family ATPase